MFIQPTRRAAACAALCLVSFTAFGLAQRAAAVSFIDLAVYRAAGSTVRAGQDLYAMRVTGLDLPMTYPPFAGLLFTPLTLLSMPVARLATTVANLLLVIVFVHLSLRLVDRPDRPPRTAVTLFVAAFAVWCEPVWSTVGNGQINLLLAVAVLGDLTLCAGRRWAGVGTGLAAGVKLTPLLFVLFLTAAGVLDRRRRGAPEERRAPDPWLRSAAGATAAFVATVALPGLLMPRDSLRFWTTTVFQPSRPGDAAHDANQSVRGLVARLLGTTDPGLPWLATALVLALLGLGTAALLATGRRDRPDLAWPLLCCATTTLLVSPVSWSHHWVWCVPLTLLVAAEARRLGSWPWWCAAAAMWLTFSSFAVWWAPGLTVLPAAVTSGLYTAAALAFLAACVARCLADRRAAER
ncbi:glycosyltransferase 87 family protein [Kitasatospora sp. NPDC052896]|uniref:glycosyltransferase 87 family protein n=1 Tax=Kitasatospora sp. NPDC052896 TaxID=3364061 RepID=UPI0037C934B5